MSNRAEKPGGGPREGFKPRAKRIRDHRDLRVWRKARKLAELCGAAAGSFPPAQENQGGLIRRLADEVADEIAIGQGQRQHAAYMDHLQLARRALHHLERRLIETHQADGLPADECDRLLARVAEIQRMLAKLMVSLDLAYARRRLGRVGG